LGGGNMKQHSALDHESRNKIYSFISENPGLHLREISRNINMSKNNLDYHLKYLIKKDLIICKKQGKYLRFYIANKVCNKEKSILLFLRKKPTRDIISIFLTNVVTSITELSVLLEKTPATIKFHLNALLENKIIELAQNENGVIYATKNQSVIIDREANGREILFRLKDIDAVYDTFVKYRKTLICHSHRHPILKKVRASSKYFIHDQVINSNKSINNLIQLYDEVTPLGSMV
jgi:DNA-binding transcriptional ArsR family regulator